MAETLTIGLLESLKAGKQNKTIRDAHKDAPTGFGVVITPAGVVSFFLNYYLGGSERRITVGRYKGRGSNEGLSITGARRRAAELRDQVLAGNDPLEAKATTREAKASARDQARKEKTVAQLVTRFLEDFASTKKDGGQRYRQLLTRFVLPKWGSLPAKGIRRADVIELVGKVKKTTPIQANRLLAVISVLFGCGLSWDWVDVNPCAGWKKDALKAPENTRDRVLESPAELKAFWSLTSSDQLTPAESACLRLILFTGLRRAEAVGLRWSEVNESERHILLAGSRTKNGLEHLLPFGDDVGALLEALPRTSVYAFPGIRSPHIPADTLTRDLASACATLEGVEPFTVHDLRRTCETGMAAAGVPKEYRDRVLNHVDPSVGAKSYNRHDYKDQKRDALDRWALRIHTLLADAAKVTPIRRAK